MAVRKIIRIDEDKCDGCGLCVPACPEGALRIVAGKAKLVSEIYCDGLGACLGECPQDAITIEEREAVPFDQEAVKKHLAGIQTVERKRTEHHSQPDVRSQAGCPGTMFRTFGENKVHTKGSVVEKSGGSSSRLTNWPIQLHLVPINAPYFNEADLLIAADCVPFSYPGFHENFLAGRTLLIGCPKLDDVNAYFEKLVEIFRQNDIRSVAVAYMEVPCCFGLLRMVEIALQKAGKNVPLSTVKIGLRGDIKENQMTPAVREEVG
jgi:Pyruvate/2-oxoacid:ferredoxin oxidoreductase delta subunit